jgi:hypothetical protein
MNLARMKPAFVQGVALAALFALGGCMSSPTYGTGKTANAQLLDDVSTAFSIKPKAPSGIKYEPRPEVLKTGSGQTLPAPQESVTKQAGVWPESPEQKRARLRQEATDAQGDPLYVPKIKNDMPTGQALAQQMALDNAGGNASSEFKKRKAIAAAGSPTDRKLLSEPPLEYRAPVGTAAYGDLGEDEAKKERRLRAEAKKKKGKKKVFSDYIPWL